MKPFLKKMNPKIYIITGLILLFILGAQVAGSGKKKVDFYRMKPVDIQYKILAAGKVRFPEPFDITAAVSGKISKIYYAEGDSIKTGDRIVQLDDFNERQNLRIAQANLELAQLQMENQNDEVGPKLAEQMRQGQANLDNARENRDRVKRLFETGLVSRSDYEKAQNDYINAEANFNQVNLTRQAWLKSGPSVTTKQQLSIKNSEWLLAQRRVEDLKVTAPFDGVISNIFYPEGQQIQAGQTLLRLIRDQNPVVEVDIDQKDLPFLELGQTVFIVLDAYPGQKLAGKIQYIAPFIDTQNGTVVVRIALDNKATFVKYGMAANVEIRAVSYHRVNGVPLSFIDIKQGKVWLWQDGRVRTQNIRFRTVAERWAIVSGISNGAILLTPGKTVDPNRVKPGREVTSNDI